VWPGLAGPHPPDRCGQPGRRVQRWQLQPGGVVFLPRNIPHAIRFDIVSRALVLSVPAGQENVFRAAGWDLSRPRPEDWQITQDALHQAAEQHGVRLIGQPHGLNA
jgi:hypothetical protein